MGIVDNNTSARSLLWRISQADRGQSMTRNPKVIWEEPRRHSLGLRQRIITSQIFRWLQWDAPHLSQNCHFPFDDLHPHLMHPSFDRPHSSPQTASIFNQSFFHNFTHETDRQTDTPTDGLGDHSVQHPLTFYRLYSDAANNTTLYAYKLQKPRKLLQKRRVSRLY